MIKNILLALALCLLFITFASCQDTTLLVHKSVKETEAVVNTNVHFTVTIYNVGQSAAYDVELKDNEWPADNFVVTGNLKATFDKIEAGHNVTHTYTVTPKIVGSVNTESAIVSFKTNPEEETKYYVKSSVLPQLTIMTQAQFDKRNDTHLDDWVIFTLLAFIPVGLPGLVYLYSKNQIDQLASQGAKKKQ